MDIKVVIWGASGHGAVIEDILVSMGITPAYFIDDDKSLHEFMGYAVFQRSEATQRSEDVKFIIGIGDNAIRKKIAMSVTGEFFTAIHRLALISRKASLGEGTVVMPGAVVNTRAQIGKHCILNTHCVVEHDCVLEDYVHVSPSATLAGNVQVGEGVQIGAGAVVIPGVRIGKWSKVGAGSVVIRDVPEYSVVVGVPGKVIKTI